MSLDPQDIREEELLGAEAAGCLLQHSLPSSWEETRVLGGHLAAWSERLPCSEEDHAGRF